MREIIYKRFKYQAGAAITLPLFGRTYILHKDPAMERCLRVHEQVHAQQAEVLGARGYYKAHIVQRNRYHGFMRLWSKAWWYGKACPIELVAYEAQLGCLQHGE